MLIKPLIVVFLLSIAFLAAGCVVPKGYLPDVTLSVPSKSPPEHPPPPPIIEHPPTPMAAPTMRGGNSGANPQQWAESPHPPSSVPHPPVPNPSMPHKRPASDQREPKQRHSANAQRDARQQPARGHTRERNKPKERTHKSIQFVIELGSDSDIIPTLAHNARRSGCKYEQEKKSDFNALMVTCGDVMVGFVQNGRKLIVVCENLGRNQCNRETSRILDE